METIPFIVNMQVHYVQCTSRATLSVFNNMNDVVFQTSWLAWYIQNKHEIIHP